MSVAIETIELCKRYQQGPTKVYGANRVNIKIEEGELVALTGRSGSGKSTILNLLGGIDTATSGKIMIKGNDITKMDDRRLTNFRSKHIGFIFQNYNLVNELTAIENIRLPLDLTNQKYDKEYENEIIKMLHLEDRLKFKPSQLSGGQQQRIAIARALITRPDIVLADEPTGNLDKKTGDDFINYIFEANRLYSQTFIIATHDIELAGKMDRIITIDDGKTINLSNEMQERKR